MSDNTVVADLLERIDADWGALWSRIERISDDELGERVGQGDGWPLPVVLAHVGRWEDWHRDAIERRLADGSVKSYAGYDTWNEAWAAEDAGVTAANARATLAELHGRFRTLLGGLQPEQWDDVILRWTQTCTYAHYEEHLGDFA